jgi:hypothetical protein
MVSLEARFISEGADPVGGSADYFKNFIQSEYTKWKKVVLASGATAR